MTTLPTVKSLYNNLLSDFQAEFSITINPFGNSFLMALSAVLAGALYLVYLAIGNLQKNIWFDTADAEILPRWGSEILGRYPFTATLGQYTATVTGSTGAVIPGTQVFKSDDTAESPGMLFQISGGPYTMPGTTGTIILNALTGGLASRLAVGDTLTPTSPIINVNSTATVTIENIVPADAEGLEEYRAKIAEKVGLDAGSWSAIDYRLVGVEIVGLLQVYAYAASGNSNTADVFLQGEIPLAYPGPSASATVVTDYETALELVKPITVWQVNYASCPINNIDVTITMGTFTAFTTAQKSLIASSLAAFVNNVHPFIAAADSVASRNDVIATFNLNAAISQAVPGYGFSAVTFTVASTPSSNWMADLGEIPFLNSISYA